eukprot:scaffold89484_cov65-Phaeocystis_antarctica.AAC.1
MGGGVEGGSEGGGGGGGVGGGGGGGGDAVRPRADRARRAGAVAGFPTRLAGGSLVLVCGAGRARRARGRRADAVRIANVRPRPCARTHAPLVAV